MVRHEWVTGTPSPWGSRHGCDSQDPTAVPAVVASLLSLPQYDIQISFSVCAIMWKWLENTAICNRNSIWVANSNPSIKCYYKQQKILWTLPATIRLFDVDSWTNCAHQWRAVLPLRIYYLGAQTLITENNWNKLRWLSKPSGDGAVTVSYMDHCEDGSLLRRRS